MNTNSNTIDDANSAAERIGGVLAWIVIAALLVLFLYGYLPRFISL